MFVVLDTNIWKQQLYLQDSAGAATRFFMRQKRAKIALPEVIRLELEEHLRADLMKHVREMQSSHRALLAIFGRLKLLVLSSQDEIDAKILSAVSSLVGDYTEIPFSLDSARASLLKTIKKQRPSLNNQQFKDGVIWADCLRLLHDDDVVLVTSDKAFFEDDDYKKGLAKTLRIELADAKFKLTLYHELAQLLSDVKSEVKVADGVLCQALLAREAENIESMLPPDAGLRIGDIIRASTSLYVTEIIDRLFLNFNVSIGLVSESGGSLSCGELAMKGIGTFLPQENEFGSLYVEEIEVRYRDENGEQQMRRSIKSGGRTHIGHADVHHKVRYDLSE
jgi:PIN domain